MIDTVCLVHLGPRPVPRAEFIRNSGEEMHNKVTNKLFYSINNLHALSHCEKLA